MKFEIYRVGGAGTRKGLISCEHLKINYLVLTIFLYMI